MSCPRCGSPREVGALCTACAGQIAPSDGLLPDHVTSRAMAKPDGWLVDGFGAAHAVAAVRTRIGRRPGSELVVLHGSVSRDHAELARAGGDWVIRDLGSRNSTRLDGKRVDGRAIVADRTIVKIGDVALLFIARPDALAAAAGEPATTQSAGAATFRAVLRGPAVELCVLGSGDTDAGGALLHRASGAAAWLELNLPPLEFHLLRTLCTSALGEEKLSPQRSRGAVLTKTLARTLPFQSRYANEENVRQVVRRLRTTLEEIDAAGVIETVPGRGYFVAWPVGLG